MGEELGAQFHRLWDECAWLHVKWRDFESLYAASESRVDLLNASARGFFRLLEDALWDDVLLHLCRLTDDPMVGRRRRQTLSIRRLAAVVDPAIRTMIKALVADAVRKAAFARDWRDRHIAHRDLALEVAEGATPLAPASRRDVSKAIGALVVDHGIEFMSRALEERAYRRCVQLDCIRPGKPVENAF
jgi:transposase InsO family protein